MVAIIGLGRDHWERVRQSFSSGWKTRLRYAYYGTILRHTHSLTHTHTHWKYPYTRLGCILCCSLQLFHYQWPHWCSYSLHYSNCTIDYIWPGSDKWFRANIFSSLNISHFQSIDWYFWFAFSHSLL